MTTLQPLKDRVLIQPDKEEDTYHGIIHLPNLGKTKPTSGLILALGPDCPQDLLNQKVLFGKYAGTEIQLNDQPFFLVREDDLLATIHESA